MPLKEYPWLMVAAKMGGYVGVPAFPVDRHGLEPRRLAPDQLDALALVGRKIKQVAVAIHA